MLAAQFSHYDQPNAKIAHLVKTGELIRLKKGLYAAADSENLNRALVANHLYGPSYVSLDWALSFYGLIPERVEEITSVTTGYAKTFRTPLGRFTYTPLPPLFYASGITVVEQGDIAFMIAVAQKALCDKLAVIKPFSIRSAREMAALLVEDLRLDETWLAECDRSVFVACLSAGFKLRRFELLIKALERFRHA